MSSINIFMLFILFISNCILAFIPHWTRKTENFGVSIPEHLYVRDDFKNMRYKYTYSLLGLNVIFFVILLITSYYVSEKIIFIVIIASIFFFIIISFLLYLPNHFTMKRIKSKERWAEDREEVTVIDTKFNQEKLTYSQGWFIIPFIIVLLTIVYTFSIYEQIPNDIPIHKPFLGDVSYKDKSISVLLFMPTIQLFMIGILLLVNYIIKRSKQVVAVQNPEGSKQQNILFRRRWSLFTIIISILMILLLSFIQFTYLYPSLSKFEDYVIFLLVTLIIVGATVLSITTGQGGSRIKIGGHAASSQIERDEDKYWKLGQFYFNKDDPSIFIEKRFGIGWTNNWAHPISWILLAIIIVIPFFIVFILL